MLAPLPSVVPPERVIVVLDSPAGFFELSTPATRRAR
jgi:hypothetical protein